MPLTTHLPGNACRVSLLTPDAHLYRPVHHSGRWRACQRTPVLTARRRDTQRLALVDSDATFGWLPMLTRCRDAVRVPV